MRIGSTLSIMHCARQEHGRTASNIHVESLTISVAHVGPRIALCMLQQGAGSCCAMRAASASSARGRSVVKAKDM